MHPQIIERIRDLVERRDKIKNFDDLDAFDDWQNLNGELEQVLRDNVYGILAALERTQEDE